MSINDRGGGPRTAVAMVLSDKFAQKASSSSSCEERLRLLVRVLEDAKYWKAKPCLPYMSSKTGKGTIS